MAKVFSARNGHALQVGNYGVATNDEGCRVPAAVALELEALVEDGEPVYRVEFESAEREAAEEAASAARTVATVQEPFHAEGGKVHHVRVNAARRDTGVLEV